MTHLDEYAREISTEQQNIAATVLSSGRRALTRATGSVTQRAAAERTTAALNAAVYRLIELAYERSEYGDWWNVCMETGRLLISPPWSDTGAKAFGLRRTSARHLRHYLRRLSGFDDAQPWLFFYDRGKWYLNIDDYGTVEAAKEFWGRWQMAAGHLRKLQTIADQKAAKKAAGQTAGATAQARPTNGQNRSSKQPTRGR